MTMPNFIEDDGDVRPAYSGINQPIYTHGAEDMPHDDAVAGFDVAAPGSTELPRSVDDEVDPEEPVEDDSAERQTQAQANLTKIRRNLGEIGTNGSLVVAAAKEAALDKQRQAGRSQQN